MSITHIVRQAARLVLLLACACCLSSCSTIGDILGYILSLPGNLFNAICP